MSKRPLENELRAGAQKVDEGHLRVDAAKALAKLRDYRLADPSHYVLDILRAAVAFKATRVKVDVDADDVSIVFNGAPLPEKLMRNLLDHALTGATGADGPRARLLALGVAGALALKPSSVIVSSGTCALSIVGDHVEVASQRASNTTSFVMKERLNWRVLAEAIRGPAEVRAIAKHCRQYPIKLELNGKEMPRYADWVIAGWAAGTAEATATTECHVALRHEPLGESKFFLSTFGVLVGARTLTMPRLQAYAWVRDDDFQRSITGSEIVREGTFLDDAEARVRALATDVLIKRAAEVTRDASGRSRESIASYLLFFHKTGGLGSLPAALKKAMETAPLFAGPAGEWYSLEELQKAIKKQRSLNVARDESLQPDSYPRPALLLGRYSNPLHSVLGTVPHNDIAPLAKKRARAAARWRDMRAFPVERLQLPVPEMTLNAQAPDASSVHSFDDDNIEGVLALGARGGIRVLCQGRFLARHHSSPKFLPIAAVVNIKGELPMEAYAEPLVDYGWGMVEHALIRATQEALRLGLRAGRLDSLRSYVRQYVKYVLHSGENVSALPREMLTAEIYPDVREGVWRSLEDFRREKVLRTVPDGDWPEPLRPVAIVKLEYSELAVLMKHFAWQNMGAQLDREREIRKVMASQGNRKIKLRGDVKTKISFVESEFSGELGVSDETDLRIALTLVWKGYPLERTHITARWAPLAAVVHDERLTPNDNWTAANRDDAWTNVVTQLRSAERDLVHWLAKQPQPQTEALVMLRSFASDELTADKRRRGLDEVAKAVLNYPLYEATTGWVSLQRVLDSMEKYPLLRASHAQLVESYAIPDDLVVIVGSTSKERTEVELLVEQTSTDAGEWLWLRGQLEALNAQPERALELPAGQWVQVNVNAEGLVGVAGVSTSPRQEANMVEVLLNGRAFHTVRKETPLALHAVVALQGDVAKWLGPSSREKMERNVDKWLVAAESALLLQCVANVDRPADRRILCEAIGQRRDASLSHLAGRSVLAAPIVPTTDGRMLGSNAFTAKKVIQYVTEPLVLKIAGDAVPVIATAEMRAWLERWSPAKRDDATLTFRARLSKGGEREAYAKISHGRDDALATVAIAQPGFEGEVSLVASGGRCLRPFVDRHPYPPVSNARLPEFLVAALNSTEFSLTSGLENVAPDEAFEKGVGITLKAAPELTKQIVPLLGKDELTPLLARFVLWVHGQKTVEKRLTDAPLFLTCDGRTVSLQDLLVASGRERKLKYSTESGELPKETLVWKPRPTELALAKEEFQLVDMTDEVRAAKARQLARRRLPEFKAPIARRPFSVAEGELKLEGEVVLLPGPPTRSLQLWFHHQRDVFDEHTMKHPVGGQVLISGPSAALMARTLRGATVQRMMKEVELALEQCVLDVLLQSDDWLEAAISWRAKHDGPLGRGLPARPILKTAGGTPVSLGKLWELTQADPLPVVAWGLGEPEVENVLSVTSLERKLLKRLKIPLKDVTEELQAKAKIQTDRLKRKLSSLTVVYAAPIRRQVGSDGFSGELVLLASPTDLPKIRLAKEQIAISDWVHLPLGVHGVLNHDELAVDETWTKFNLTESLRRKMLAEVEGLYELLLTKIPKLSTRERVWASHHALNQWRHHGITSPSHLATLTGPARGLADAPLFETARGEWVPLSALASQYEKSGAIPVMNDGADDEAFADLLILRDGERYGWHVVNELASVFGQRLFKRYGSAEDLKRVLEEADPLDGTEQKRSLVRLRRLAKMLAGPLFGRLGAEELKEIRVHRGKKSVPVDYDAQRGTALLNLSTPCVAKALETASAHPERLYVLLLSLYGAVNRELEHITDEDEARLSTALLAHLAQNENALKAAE